MRSNSSWLLLVRSSLVLAATLSLTGCGEMLDKLYKPVASKSTDCDDLRDQEKYKEAISCYEEELKKKPSDSDIFDNIAYCYYQAGQYEKSIQTANRALKVNEKDEYAYDYRAASKYQLKQYKEAVQDFDKELELNAEDANAFLQRGDVYADMKQPDQAIKDYSQAISLDADNAAGYYSRGLVYFAQKKYQEAQTDFEEAVKLDGDDKTYQCNYGSACDALKEYDKALDAFAAARKIDDTWCDSYLHAGTVLLMQGKKEEAIDEFRKLLIDKTNTFYGGVYLYLTYLADGDTEDARDALKASEMERSDGEWPYAVAVYFKGQISDSQLFAVAREGDHLSEARCYAGINEILKGNKARGLEHLKWVQDNANKMMPEQRLARWGMKLAATSK